MGRIAIAVVVGFVLWSVLWLVAGFVVTTVSPRAEPVEGQPVESPGILVTYIIISVVISVVSGFVAVKAARGAADTTGWILAVALFIVGLAVELGQWDTMAAWYHIVFLILLIPSVMAGARLAARQSARRPAG
jgi:hypothetical protein